MDKTSKMLQKSDAKRPTSKDARELGAVYLKAANYLEAGNAGLLKTPKRKLSVFSFDIAEPATQEGERRAIEVRRSSSSPSVRATEKLDEKSKETEPSQKACPQEEFVNDYQTLVESAESSSSSSPERRNDDFPVKEIPRPKQKIVPAPPAKSFLPPVRSGTAIGNGGVMETSFERQLITTNFGSEKFKEAFSVFAAIDQQKLKNETPKFSANLPSNPAPKIFPGAGTIQPYAPRRSDPAKIKDSGYTWALPSAAATDRFSAGRSVRSVGPEMSGREDSSIGSDSEDDSIERTVLPCVQNGTVDQRNEQPPPLETDFPSTPPPTVASISPTSNSSRKEPASTINDRDKTSPDVSERRQKQQKRQRIVRVIRSLSESDGPSRQECRCKHVTRRESCEQEELLRVFPSLTDERLRASGLSNMADTVALYRENLPEDELERKYTAFSIGLGTDRITLQRRMALSLRQRDLSERSFTCEVQRMQQDIQELSPLCTDRESIERVERVRHRLEMVARCAHRVSCAAETLGAVHQENRISRAILIADRYLQLLRSRCENLAAEVAETKRILLKNNIVIEETSGDLADDLPRIRYRSGVPSNNRTMMARRRASIATISRPLASSQDITKEGPRQRNSVSGRVTLRRPSLSSESQKWESEKLHRTDSSNSIGELRDIFEQAECRLNSVEENNNVLRIEQSVDLESNCIATDVTTVATITSDDDENWQNSDQEPFSESTIPESVKKEIKLCMRTAESLRITKNLVAWRSMLWCILIFFLGFYVKHVISSGDPYDISSRRWWSAEGIFEPYWKIRKTSSPRV